MKTFSWEILSVLRKTTEDSYAAEGRDLRLLPLQQIDKLSDDPTDLFSVSTAKLQGIAMELYCNLQSLIP